MYEEKESRKKIQENKKDSKKKLFNIGKGKKVKETVPKEESEPVVDSDIFKDIDEEPDKSKVIDTTLEDETTDTLENETADTLEEDSETKKKNRKNKKIFSNKVISFQADWIGVLIKFGVFLVIAFVVIFIGTKIKNLTNNNSFSSNLDKMKEVAYTYFKVDTHRPASSSSVYLTLEDMIDGSLIKEFKGPKNSECSKDESYISLTKNDNNTYDMYGFLTCGGEKLDTTWKNLKFDEENKESSNTNNNNNNNNEFVVDDDDNKNTNSNKKETILYELTRNVTSNATYSCPSGYTLVNNSYCLSAAYTESIAATAMYKNIPEKNTRANYKSETSEYEYTDPIVLNNAVYKCSSGYTLVGNKCRKEVPVNYKGNVSYYCPEGGTLEGRRCTIYAESNYVNEKYYCSKGTLINGDECKITTNYTIKCLHGSVDNNRKSCYTTYTASRELSDWIFDSYVIYSENKVLKDTDKVKYEDYDYLDNGKIKYKKYIKKNVYVCEDDDTLDGSKCKHYDDSYIQKKCSSGYSLSSDGRECIKYTDARTKNVKGYYSCPNGYSKKGSGDDITCYRTYTASENKTNGTPYCSGSYTLTSDNKCIKEIDATLDKASYTCPNGYTMRGSGKNALCYKKTTKDAYYYCSNKNATLNGDRCIVPASTEFLGYKCPGGYTSSGSMCYKYNVKDRISATKSEGTVVSTETIWSKVKDVKGWIFTGNTKTE